MNRNTCEGCPISENRITTDTLCTDYCHSVENWLQAHDAEVRAKAIDEFAEQMKWEYRESIGTSEREIHFACAVIEQVAEQLKVGGKHE